MPRLFASPILAYRLLRHGLEDGVGIIVPLPPPTHTRNKSYFDKICSFFSDRYKLSVSNFLFFDRYKLSVSDFSVLSSLGDVLGAHNGEYFTTHDQDNDSSFSEYPKQNFYFKFRGSEMKVSKYCFYITNTIKKEQKIYSFYLLLLQLLKSKLLVAGKIFY